MENNDTNNSNKKTIGVVVVLALLVGGYLLYKNPTNRMMYSDNVQNEAGMMGQSDAKKMAFSEFIKQGGSYKCTVNQTINGTETKGITYVSNGMMRGEYSMTVSGVNMTSNMIMRDGYTYSWSSMAPTMGFKMKSSAGVPGTPDASAAGQYGFDASQIGDYDCQKNSGDTSVFTLPDGVTFREM